MPGAQACLWRGHCLRCGQGWQALHVLRLECLAAVAPAPRADLKAINYTLQRQTTMHSCAAKACCESV